MKRKGYIVEKVAAWENLVAADEEAQAGKLKRNRFIRRHNERKEEDLRALQQMILTLTFPPHRYDVVEMKSDAGKIRRIAKEDYFPWRILHRAILRVVGDDLVKSLIYDTCACIKGRGLHYGVRRMKMMLRRYPEYKWFGKTDYKKFYESIPHRVVTDTLRRKFKDERFIKLMGIGVLAYCSDVEEVLANEREKRLGNRKFSEPGIGERCCKQNRSLHERATPCKVLPAIL